MFYFYSFLLTLFLIFITIIMVINMAFILIFLTLLYASLDSLTQSNFTVIGNIPGNFYYFLIWTFFIATYFLYNSSNVFKKYHFTFKWQHYISLYIYFACLLTPLIPYTQTNPFFDDLHVFLAMSSSILFLGVWLIFLWHIHQIYPQLSKKIEVPFWIFIQTLIGCLFFFGQINSIIELLLVISMIFLIEFLKKN